MRTSEQMQFDWGEPGPSPVDSASFDPLNVAPGDHTLARSADKCLKTPGPSNARVAQIEVAANALHRELSQRCGLRLQLRITDNSTTMLTVNYGRDGVSARVGLHHMFLTAPPEVTRALATWLKKPRARKSGGVLDRFIQARQDQIRAARPRTIRLRRRGRHHDLAALFEQVNAAHFNGKITTPITWGRMPSLRRRRSIRFGSYSPAEELIRIHPLLDQDFVPRFFVRYIVFHEMLHAQLGIEERASGRRSIHPPEFMRREKEYPDYLRALDWIEKERNMGRLLGGRRRRRA